MNIVGCLDSPTKGKFVLLGRDVSELSDDELAKVEEMSWALSFKPLI